MYHPLLSDQLRVDVEVRRLVADRVTHVHAHEDTLPRHSMRSLLARLPLGAVGLSPRAHTVPPTNCC